MVGLANSLEETGNRSLPANSHEETGPLTLWMFSQVRMHQLHTHWHGADGVLSPLVGYSTHVMIYPSWRSSKRSPLWTHATPQSGQLIVPL